ncbi:MAG: aromatic ring-hydroxylating dioxygenase subunit alpha [Candidatus Nanopelagicales bacterium]
MVTPAPLDAQELQRCVGPVEQARLLPRGAYVDAAVLQWEQHHFFGDWICAGRSADIAEPGMQRAVSVGTSGVLLTRGEDGALHAFVNTCRHRGHELLPCGGSATKKSIVCPYHAWSYRLDGNLHVAPGFRDVETFDKTEFSLYGLPVREWHGWIFVAPSGKAGDFDHHIGELEAIVAPYAPENLEVVTTHDYVIEANWKILIENYQECYHCSMIHPELCRVSPPESGENLDREGEWVGGWMDLREGNETMSLDGRSSSVRIEGLDEQEQHTVMYIAVFPNLLISLHPDYVMTHVLTPLSAGRTHVECAWAFPREAVQRIDFEPSNTIDFWDITNRQDWGACESVQRGLAAEQAIPGPMAPEEDGVYHFVSMVAARYLGVGTVAELPPPAATQQSVPAPA